MSDTTGDHFALWLATQLQDNSGSMTWAEFLALNTETDEDTNTNETRN